MVLCYSFVGCAPLLCYVRSSCCVLLCGFVWFFRVHTKHETLVADGLLQTWPPRAKTERTTPQSHHRIVSAALLPIAKYMHTRMPDHTYSRVRVHTHRHKLTTPTRPYSTKTPSTKRQQRKSRHTKGGGGQQPPGNSQQPGGKHKGGESARVGEKREANKTNNTQRQGPRHTGPETRESRRQRRRRKEKEGKKKQGTERRRRKPRVTKGKGGGRQSPGSSQRPGRRHKRGESTRRGEKREANRTYNTQRQGPGHPGPETKESQRQRGRGRKEEKKTQAGGGGRKRKQGAKAQGTRGWKPKKARDKGGARKTTKEDEKKKHQERGNLSPEGAEQSRKTKRPQEKVRRTRTRPGGLPARPSQDGQAHAHTHGNRAWRPPCRKGRCRRQDKTALVHWLSPPSKDRRYGKRDASVTGSTHADHRSARSPRPARDLAGTTPSRGPKRVRRGASPAPLPWRGPAAGTMSPVLGRPPRAPRSRPVKPRAQAPGVGKHTMSSGKPTGAPRATGPDQARRTTRGHKARQRGTPLAATKAHGQVTSNNGRRVPQTRRARTTRNEPRHRNRCQATPAAAGMDECVPGGYPAPAGYEQPPSGWRSARPAAYPAPAGYEQRPSG